MKTFLMLLLLNSINLKAYSMGAKSVSTPTENSISELKSYLTNKKIFFYKTHHWRFKDNNFFSESFPYILKKNNPHLKKEEMENFIKETIFNGLVRMMEINPQIAIKSLSLLSKSLKFVMKNSIQGAHADTTLYSRTSRSPRIRLTSSVTDAITISVNPNLVNNKYFKQKKDSKMLLPKEFAENAIFHEFLHAMKVDNLTPQDHSDAVRVPSFGNIHGIGTFEREDDIVFACSNLIYTTEYTHQYWKRENETGAWAKVPVTHNSCRVCYQAFDNKVSESYLASKCDKF